MRCAAVWPCSTSLNRTFYGIETSLFNDLLLRMTRLNRTFYGIETGKHSLLYVKVKVLIVPFMELKPRNIK